MFLCSIKISMFWGAFVVLCLMISFSTSCATLKSLLHTIHKAKPSPVQDFWMNLKLESLNFSQYLFFFDGSELPPIFFEMSRFFSRYRFYSVIIRKLGLNENKIWCHPRSMNGAENLNDICRFKYKISINYVSFWKFLCLY